MGAGWRDFDLILRLKDEGYISSGGAVVEIGAQQLSNDFLRNKERVKELAHAFGVTTSLDLPDPTEPVLLHGKLEHLDSNAPPARDVWTWLGYEYAAVDIDGSPGSIPLDLNFDEVPGKLKKRFQLATNFGTTEHVANQLQAFKIIHDLVATVLVCDRITGCDQFFTFWTENLHQCIRVSGLCCIEHCSSRFAG